MSEAYQKILNKSPKPRETHTLLSIAVGAKRSLTLEELDVTLNLYQDEHCTRYADLDLDGENIKM